MGAGGARGDGGEGKPHTQEGSTQIAPIASASGTKSRSPSVLTQVFPHACTARSSHLRGGRPIRYLLVSPAGDPNTLASSVTWV